MAFERPGARSLEGGQAPSLNEEETLAYLETRGIRPLDEATWRPGQSILYVLDDMIRENDDTLSSYSPNRVPSIARVESPTAIHFDRPHEVPLRNVIYRVDNDGSQVAYYAINRMTQRPELIRISHRVTSPKNQYVVRKDRLFVAADDLFPKADE